MAERTTDKAAAQESPGNSPKAAKVKATPKLPTTITHQVLVGLMNDLLSTCTFLTLPETPGHSVELVKGPPGPKRQYMLVLRFEKKGITYETLSHDFSANLKDSNNEGARPDEAAATQLAIGVMAAIHGNLEEPTPFAKLSISMLNGYIKKTLNRGGMWAYMSLPSFLGSTGNDEPVVKERRDKIVRDTKDGVAAITGTTIIALLWVMHYIKADKVLSPICNTLVKEFLQWHAEPQLLANALYMGSLMGYLSHEELVKATIKDLNHVNILETLTGEELVVLLGAFNNTDALNLPPVRKTLLILTEEVERLSPQCIACLLWTLVKLKYNFDANTHFTRQMMLRLSNVFDDLPLSNTFLFSALAFVPCEMLYYDIILDSVMLKLHLMDNKEIVMIGASYAFSSNLKSVKADVDAPRSEHIYHCLEFYVKRTLTEATKHDDVLLRLVYESVLSDPALHFTEKIAQSSIAFPRDSLSQSARRVHTRTPVLGPKGHESGSSEAFKSATTSTNAFKLFYLNLLEDCCIRYEKLDFESTCYLVFALLTFHIDVSPLHQAMLVTQGLMLRKANNPVKIIQTSPNESIKQYSMARELLQYAQSPTDPKKALIIEGLESQCHPLPGDIQVEAVQESQEPTPIDTPKSVASTKTDEKEESRNDPKEHQSEEPVPPLTMPPPALQPEEKATTPLQPERTRQDDMRELLLALTAAIKAETSANQINMEDIIHMCQGVLGTPVKVAEGKPVMHVPSSARSAGSAASRTRNRGKESNKVTVNNSIPATAEKAVAKSGWKLGGGTRKTIAHIPHTDEQYCIMYKIRRIRYHRAELLMRRVAISYTYEKVKGLSK